MIVVIGSDPKCVELRDLEDTVYYKQQKVFTKEQYEGSSDLQKAIKDGKLTVIEKSRKENVELDIPAYVPTTVSVPAPQVVRDDTLLRLLLEKMDGLTAAVKDKQTASPDEGVVDAIYKKLQELENQVKNNTPGDSSELTDTLKELAEKVTSGGKNSEVLDRLVSILDRVEKGKESEEPFAPGEVYVPTVSVEDAKTHIKLDVRTIEKADVVNASLKALRALRDKKT